LSFIAFYTDQSLVLLYNDAIFPYNAYGKDIFHGDPFRRLNLPVRETYSHALFPFAEQQLTKKRIDSVQI
jgi:hypothetical protein